jgi:putative transposase
VPLEYSITRLICSVTCGLEAVMLAGRVLLKIVYLLLRRVLGFAVLVAFRRDLTKDAELLALRYENAMLRRQVKRTRYEPADRVWFATLAQLIPRGRWAGSFP